VHDRPTLHEILDVVQGFLEAEVVPATTARTQFLARVAANLLGQADREIQLESDHFDEAWTGLEALLGAAPAPSDRASRREAVERRLSLLCEEIRCGRLDPGSAQHETLLHVLRALVRAKLQISNPALLAADAERGIA
jgi:hypothetical protein